jgi:hypothetical protein
VLPIRCVLRMQYTTAPLDGSTTVNEIVNFPGHESLIAQLAGYHPSLDSLLTPDH